MIAVLPHHYGDKVPGVYAPAPRPTYSPSDAVILPVYFVPPHDPAVNNGCSEWNTDADPNVEHDNQGAPCAYDVP